MLLLCSSVSVLYDLEFDLFIFFFFKRKTAYELRISDWSSDVCSSDLKASLRYEDVPTWLRRIYTNYDFQITSNWHYNLADPVIGVHRLFHSESIRKGTVFTNASHWSTPETDKLMDADALEVDTTNRADLQQTFQNKVAHATQCAGGDEIGFPH